MERFYKPYTSDDSDTETDSDGYTSEESLVNVPGKNPPVGTGGPFLLSSNNPTPSSGTKFEQQETKNSSLITINSRDRDTNTYPQPTFFTLRLPRVFRSVKTINISQLNLLNSFFNFALSAGNTFLYVQEQDREPVRIQIRDGTYSSNDLVTELSSALNATPLFANISLGSFISGFQSTGDFSQLFNTPGAVVYNSLTQTYDANQTINDIIARYFTTTATVGTVTYTYAQSTVGYYYPVMKEMIITGVPFNISILDSTGNPVFTDNTEAYTYLVFYFQGINDPKVTILANDVANQALFDAYRRQNTFGNFLVNFYKCSYNTKQGRLVINAPTLNASIVADFTTQYAFFLSQAALSNATFSSLDDFLNQYSNVSNINNSLIGFYNFIQGRFTSNFGINFGTYAAEFYADSSNAVTLYNTSNKYGWSPTLTPGVSASTLTSNLVPPQIPIYWSNINIPMSTVQQNAFISTSFSTLSLTFPNTGGTALGYFDVVTPLYPTTYQRMLFSSPIRRNINIMTIPRYSTNYTSTNDMVFNLSPQSTPYLFDNRNFGSTFFIRTDISGNLLLNLYNVAQNMFASPDYMRLDNKWLTYMTPQILAGSRLQISNPNYGQYPPINDIVLTSFRPFIFFEMIAENYTADPNAHFNITFYIETQDDTPLPVPIVLVMYKDRAAFMADIQNELNGNVGQENPYNYFQKESYANTNSAQMVVDVNNNQHLYFIVRTDTNSPLPNQIQLRVFALLTDAYGVYRPATRLDYFDLPFRQSTLVDQNTPTNPIYQDPLLSIYNSSITQIGYDISGVSNNLLDYTIHAGNNKYYDPLSVADYLTGGLTGLEYQFSLSNSGAQQPPSDTTGWSLFFGSNSSNVILDTYNTCNNVYLSSLQTPKPLAPGLTNEFSLVNWWNPINLLIFNPEFFTISSSSDPNHIISVDSIFQPCQNTPPLATDSVTSVPLNNGFIGISFYLPPNEIVSIKNFAIKFAYTQPSIDNNSNLFTRTNSPLVYTGQTDTGNIYKNQTTFTSVDANINDWDDWYLLNRQNLKIGVFRTGDISGAALSLINIQNALLTMTLTQISQVNNYTDILGTLRTREPEWATYYNYTVLSSQTDMWDIINTTYDPMALSTFYVRNVEADFGPTYVAGASSYTNFFLTHPNINNYTYLQRSFGISPTVRNAYDFPSTISSFGSDIDNSYTIVPFTYNQTLSSYQVSGFFGTCITINAALPSTNLTGASPYYGPMGPFAWVNDTNHFTNYFGTYFNSKLTWESIHQDYDPATDLSVFGGFDGISGEYQNTMLFAYKNNTADADLLDVKFVYSTISNWVWGQEKNTRYIAFDSNAGYNNLSYIYDLPIVKNNEYAIHMRSYDPIPSFTSGVRIIGKNVTDFGTVGLYELADEISSIKGYHPITEEEAGLYSAQYDNAYFTYGVFAYNDAVAPNYSTLTTNGSTNLSIPYANALVNFDRQFSTTVTLGKTQTYTGETYTFGGYADAISTYISVFAETRSILSTFTLILSTASGNLNTYVNTRYGSVLPSSILNRNRITDPLPFSLLFSTYTLAPYKNQYDEWGLGYNLGFNKVDTPLRTTVTSDTFIRIVQNYIYLRISPELNVNTMATSGKESLAECRESGGQDAKYFSKILLNNFGSYSQTAVQRPKEFNPVLGKYETMSCQLTDKYGNQLSSIDCEYDFVLQIDEITNGPNPNSSLLGPTSDLDVYKQK